MGEIRGTVILEGAKKTKQIDNALFDSGSTFGHLDESIAEDIGFAVFPIEHEITIGDGTTMKVKPALGYMTVNGCKKPILIGVAKKGATPLTIGLAQMQLMGIKLDPQKETFSVRCTLPKA